MKWELDDSRSTDSAEGTGEQLEREIRQSRGVKVGGKQIGERRERFHIPKSPTFSLLNIQILILTNEFKRISTFNMSDYRQTRGQ